MLPFTGIVQAAVLTSATSSCVLGSVRTGESREASIGCLIVWGGLRILVAAEANYG